MKKTGQELEHLIHEIERTLTPKGIAVRLNERVFNDEGIQIAEFDIFITGKLGSSSIYWLIECRDRPSDGPAPCSWIEQLVGRRTRFNFDKVIAVSTTGFVEEAKKFAKREGILLRTVEAITELASDFEVVNIPNIPWKLLRVDILDELDLKVKLANPEDRQYLGAQKFYQIKFPHEEEFYHPKDFITKVIHDYPIFADAENDYREKINFEYLGDADVRIEKKHIVRILKFATPIELTIKFFKGDALAVKVYAEEDRVIGKEVAFRINLPEGEMRYRVLIMEKSDNEQVVKLYYPDEMPSQYGGIRIGSINLMPPE